MYMYECVCAAWVWAACKGISSNMTSIVLHLAGEPSTSAWRVERSRGVRKYFLTKSRGLFKNNKQSASVRVCEWARLTVAQFRAPLAHFRCKWRKWKMNKRNLHIFCAPELLSRLCATNVYLFYICSPATAQHLMEFWVCCFFFFTFSFYLAIFSVFLFSFCLSFDTPKCNRKHLCPFCAVKCSEASKYGQRTGGAAACVCTSGSW